jgi:dolichyl-phosphate-mannose-protein mannosyltransferase
VATTATDAPADPPAAVGNDPDPDPVHSPYRYGPLSRLLAAGLPDDGPRSWVPALAITLIAGIFRFLNLSHPPDKIFDEVYYATDAHSLLTHGVELTEKGGPGFVAHPPLGKWLIAIGESVFGYDSFGWRVPAAVAGTISVLLLARIARRLFGSTLLGCLAALLLTLDGLHFVSSRVALLDIFLMLFVLAGFGFLLLDRDLRRQTVFAAQRAGEDLSGGLPRTAATVPWFRFAAALMLGCGLGVKWSAAWYIVAFALLAVAWELGLRRTVGVRYRWWDVIRRETGWTAAFGGTTLLVYLATWSGWFASDQGWDRNWAAAHGHRIPLIPDAVVNLARYHYEVLTFHTGLGSHHDYQSSPASWLLLGRPVAFYYTGDVSCGAPDCSSEVIAIGTPLLWWSFLVTLVVVAWRWLAHRDWRAGALLVGAGASIVPWLLFPARTMFLFYALPGVPFLVMTVAMSLGLVLGSGAERRDRRLAGAIIVGGYVLLVAATFLFFHPVLTGAEMQYDEWRARMWFDRWI